MIYDFSNEYGGVILADSDTPGAGLQVNSNASKPAIAILSTASANPIDVNSFDLGSRFRSVQTIGQALIVGRTVVGATTIAPLHVQHPSAASAVVLSFGGGFISVTSILGTAATGAALGFDYVLPVTLNGVVRGIPLTSLASLPGAAAF